MTAGLLNKAERGELALSLPVGLIRDAHDRVSKDPNLEVQTRLALIFSTFLRVRSASKVLDFFNTQELELQWEAALRALKQAEATYAQRHFQPEPNLNLPPELQTAFRAIGQQLPHL